MKTDIIFQTSPWYLLLCIAVGLVFAWLLYRKSTSYSGTIKKVLFGLRAVSVATICFLLLDLLLKNNHIVKEKQLLVVAIDNSASLSKVPGLAQMISDITQTLKDADIDMVVETFKGTTEQSNDIKFDHQSTDISSLISQAKENNSDRSIGQILLLSDGIVNTGMSPTGSDQLVPIHSLGLGDTTLKKDVRISGVAANKLAYLGNKFPVNIDITSFGFDGKSSTVILKDENGIIDKKVVTFSSAGYQNVELFGISKSQGLKKLTVEVLSQPGEVSTKNNHREVVIEVVNGKEKILIVGVSPHPDLKALKAIFEKNELYDVAIQTVSGQDAVKIPEFDLLVLHQIPDLNALSKSLQSQLLEKGKPVFFIVGAATNIMQFNGVQQVLGINASANQLDQVSGVLNPNFKLFQLNQNAKVFESAPPIKVPFGDVRLGTGAEVILFQRVGNTQTSKPLLAVNINAPRKAAVLVGEGLWQWRMAEYAETEKNEAVDELISKTLQLISVKNDKRRLRVDPLTAMFEAASPVRLQVETYNQIFERIYDQDVQIQISGQKIKTKEYNFKNAQGQNTFEVSGLPAGSYTFNASATLNGKAETATGQFFIIAGNLENENLQADWNLLRRLSQNSGGKFFKAKEIGDFLKYIKENKPAENITNREEIQPPTKLKWLLALLLCTVFAEWILRKYFGFY